MLNNTSSAKYKVYLLAGKARVTALKGTTTPRSEFDGLLISSRLLLLAVKSLNEKPSVVRITGDSQCTIAVMEAVLNE